MPSRDDQGIPRRVPTGVTGLDSILRGGLPPERTCLVQGAAGTGKTTLALQFLREGLRHGERSLYLTLLQSEAELSDVAAAHGWDLSGLAVAHVPEKSWAEADGQSLFSTYDVEFAEIADVMASVLQQHRPQRLVIDSIGELGMLVENSHQLRRSLLRLKLELNRSRCTALVTAGDAVFEVASALDTVFNGVIRLTQDAVLFGRTRRRLEVVKQRGIAYLEGRHDMRICTGGVAVFPRLEWRESAGSPPEETFSSGLDELDSLMGGGLHSGTACLLAGTTGAGKSTIASLFVRTGAAKGHKGAVYCFDERRDTFLRRAAGLGIDLHDYIESGRVNLRELAVGEVSAGEFVHEVRHAVEDDGARIVVIDSLNGFIQAMDNAREVVLQLHELLSFLGSAGVLTLMIVTEHGLPASTSEIDASYLSDAVLLLRHFESRGSIQRCIAVTKKRHGPHESTLRQLHFSPGQIRVGPVLAEFDGLLTGTPVFHGNDREVMGHDDRSNDH